MEDVWIFSESIPITNITRYNLSAHASLGQGRGRRGSPREMGVGQRAQFRACLCRRSFRTALLPPVGPHRSACSWSSVELLRWALLTAMLKMSAPDGLVVTFSQNSWEPLPTSLWNGKDNFLKCWLTEQNVLELVTDFFFLLSPSTHCKITYGDSKLEKDSHGFPKRRYFRERANVVAKEGETTPMGCKYQTPSPVHSPQLHEALSAQHLAAGSLRLILWFQTRKSARRQSPLYASSSLLLDLLLGSEIHRCSMTSCEKN